MITKSPKSMARSEDSRQHILKAQTTLSHGEWDQKVDHQKQLLKQHQSLSKRSDGPLPSPDGQSAQLPHTSSMPSRQEMESVLSPEEIESWERLWSAGKEFRRTLTQVEKGRVLSREEEEVYLENKRAYNEARTIERHVQAELVRTNRARPELREGYLRRMALVSRKNTRMRRDELRSLIDNDQASAEQVEEYEHLLAKFKRESQEANERHLKRLNRMRELETRVKNGDASAAEAAELKKIQETRDRKSQREKQRSAKAWAAKKAQIEELETKIRTDVATDTERAKYQELIAERDERLEYQNEGDRRRRAKKKAEFEALERKVRYRLATAAEVALYKEMSVKRQKERERRKNLARKRRAKEKAAAEYIPPLSPKTHSEGQSDGNQPLPLSYNPTLRGLDSFLTHFGRVLMPKVWPRDQQNRQSELHPVPYTPPFRFKIIP